MGSGASTLVDGLLAAGWSDLTLLDVSEEALDRVRARLGGLARRVRFVASDARVWHPERRYGAWHDRAVLNFLVDPGDRARYVEVAARAIRPGGVAVIGAFATDGPSQCSGLPTVRYDTAGLAAALAPPFVLEHAEREEHRTPAGIVQPFSWVVWVVLRRRAEPSEPPTASRVRPGAGAPASSDPMLVNDNAPSRPPPRDPA